MENNIFMNNLKEIVKTSYAGGDFPKFDWNTSIDMWYRKNENLFEGVAYEEKEKMRKTFRTFVDGKKFDKDGNEA